MFKQQTFLLISLVSIFILAWILQANILLNWDVSWLLHGTQRILTGGTYANDFPDGDPPMILYIYAPAFLLIKKFSIQFFNAIRAYIFLIIFISLSISYMLIGKIFSREHRITGMLFLIILALVLLIVPVFEFGQREHLILILTMPYLFALSCRLENKKIPSYLAFFIGILAGCGFAIKPYYWLILGLVEIYYIFYSRNLLAWLRIESLLIITIFIAHLLVVVFFHRDYLTVVIPLLWRFYYVSIGRSWLTLIIQPSFIFCCFAVLFYFIQYQNAYKKLSTILCIALIGYIITYLVQRTIWYYHILPMFSAALLLIFLAISALLTKNPNKSYDYLFFVLILIFINIFPFFYIRDLYLASIVYKEKTAKLREYLHDNALHQPVYFFSTVATLEFPSVYYADAIHVSRFGVLNWIPAMLKKTNNPLQQSKDEKYFIDSIANELNNFKPKWVFIDSLSDKGYLQGIDFNYLTYFSRNKQFQQAWKAYHYKTSIQEKPFYAVLVYQRDDDQS